MKWVKSGSFIEPLRTDDTLSKIYVYIRKNIVKRDVDIGGVTVPYYQYDETLMKKDEYYAVEACFSETAEQTETNTEDIGETEDALCELSETMDDAIAALEQAICDLSEEIGGEE